MKANMKHMAFVLVAMIMSVSVALAGCTPPGVDDDAVLESISINEGYKADYTVGDTFEVDQMTITAKYDTKATETLNLTSEGVSYTPNPFTLDTVGTKTLTVSYTKNGVTKSDTAEITVHEALSEDEDIVIVSFAAPTTYSKYMADYKETAEVDHTSSETRDYFMQGGGTYKVGNINGFVFKPVATALNPENPRDRIPVENAKTTFELFVANKDGTFPQTAEPNPSQYVNTKEGEAQRNIYYFTEKAVDMTFRLVIKLDGEEYDTEDLAAAGDDVITAEVKVVEGYNVYNQIGLSVLDNLNVKHWNELKTAAGTLPWDEKPLVEYNVLKEGEKFNYIPQVVLHANITIDPDQLPDNYFWDKDRTNVEQGYKTVLGYVSSLENLTYNGKTYAELLNGSLRDYEPTGGWNNFNSASNGDLAEDYSANSVNMQKALYNVAGTNIQGNCMQLSYKPGEKHNLFTIYDSEPDAAGTMADASPLSHWSLIKYMDEQVVAKAYPNLLTSAEGEEFAVSFDVTPTVENLRIKGNMPRLEKTDGMPAHLMAFNTCVDELTLKNTIISQVFVATTGDSHHDSDFIHAADGANIIIDNSKIVDIYSNMFYVWRATATVKNSVLQEAGGPLFLLVDGNRNGSTNDEKGSHLIVDDASTLENFAIGTEPWYVLNNAQALFNGIKGLIRNIAHGFGREFVVEETRNGVKFELVNIIAAVICDPGKLMENCSNDMIYPSGTISRGDKDAFVMNPAFDTGNDPFLTPVAAGLYSSEAPMFFSGLAQAAFVNGALPNLSELYPGMGAPNLSGIPMVGKGFNVTSGKVIGFSYNPVEVVTSWAEAVGMVTDWTFVTMRASASMKADPNMGSMIPPSFITPRFGVLLGSSTAYTAPQA